MNSTYKLVFLLSAFFTLGDGQATLDSARKKKCGKNQIYSECGNNACQNTCANPSIALVCFAGCVPGCICAEGYLKNSKGVCVLPKDCEKSTPTCTGIHEVYSECGNNSCQKNCDTIGKNVACRPICTPGCICEEGYIRNKSGVCVTPDHCENKVCTGKNEAYTECVCPCCESCATLGQDITCNFRICNPGCDCKPGFFRNSKRECVPPEECDCEENEELDMCFNPCPPQTCSAIGKVFKCAAACKPACKCKFNYRRNAYGICIPIQECPALTCNGKNEVFDSCPPDCLDQRCESLYETIFCTLNVKECQPRCVCKDDFLRNQNGVCIPDTQCPCPDVNAEVVSCPNPCPGGTCDYPEFSPCDAPCKNIGCQCKKGYVKDANGKCILLAECFYTKKM